MYLLRVAARRLLAATVVCMLPTRASTSTGDTSQIHGKTFVRSRIAMNMRCNSHAYAVSHCIWIYVHLTLSSDDLTRTHIRQSGIQKEKIQATIPCPLINHNTKPYTISNPTGRQKPTDYRVYLSCASLQINCVDTERSAASDNNVRKRTMWQGGERAHRIVYILPEN